MALARQERIRANDRCPLCGLSMLLPYVQHRVPEEMYVSWLTTGIFVTCRDMKTELPFRSALEDHKVMSG